MGTFAALNINLDTNSIYSDSTSYVKKNLKKEESKGTPIPSGKHKYFLYLKQENKIIEEHFEINRSECSFYEAFDEKIFPKIAEKNNINRYKKMEFYVFSLTEKRFVYGEENKEKINKLEKRLKIK